MGTFRRKVEVEPDMEDKAKKAAYNMKYKKERTTTINMRLHYKIDADILEYTKNLPSKQGLIKRLLRRQMAEEGFVYTPTEETE